MTLASRSVAQKKKLYFHDRLLAVTLLRLIPDAVTPNNITVSRLFMTPLVVWLVWSGNYGFGLPFFIFVAFTDALDGSLARVTGRVTEWGTFWDPVVDKLLITSVLIVFVFQFFPIELAASIVGLEAILIAGGWLRKRQGRYLSANGWGKTKMVLQVVGVSAYMLASSGYGYGWAMFSYGVLAAAVTAAVISFFSYGS